MKKIIYVINLYFLMLLIGCSFVGEGTKKILGISVQSLYEARETASRKSYACSFEQCFDAVLELARDEKAYQKHLKDLRQANLSDDENIINTPYKRGIYDLFRKSYRKSYIVAMGVAGHLETTEVGIIFEEEDDKIIIEVSSLSFKAKDYLAKQIFKNLDKQFKVIP